MAFSLSGGKNFVWLAPEQISVNPNQPRKLFREEELSALTDSIARYGVLQPLTVRREKGGYQLIAGERRLRAAGRAGLRRVPCYVVETDEQGSSLMALVENLQRQDLDPFEEAEGLQRLTKLYGMTQKEAAQQVGKTQPAVANKIRLLKLEQATIQIVRKQGLTERHARALLRLEEESERLKAVRHIAKMGLTVARAEEYVERCIQRLQTTPPAGRRTFILKDVRLFLNSIDRGVHMMKEAGVHAKTEREETEEEILLTIRIPKCRR